jgi:hypothetical protein
MENNYTYARSRRGRHFYIHNDDTVYVASQDEHYHLSWLSDNNIVELENGEYEHSDEAVEVDGDYYHIDDERIVCDHQGDYQLRENCTELENGEYALDDECWYCEGSQAYYLHIYVEPVVIDGDNYHPDHVPETQDTEANPTTQGE